MFDAPGAIIVQVRPANLMNQLEFASPTLANQCNNWPRGPGSYKKVGQCCYRHRASAASASSSFEQFGVDGRGWFVVVVLLVVVLVLTMTLTTMSLAIPSQTST